MIRIFNFLLVALLTVALWACSGSGASTETDAPASAEVVEAPAAPAADFSVTILNDSIASPRKEMTAALGSTALTINYGSPSLKGRAIGTELAKFGETWRAGANEATTFEVSTDVEIEGQTLPAGKYGFFTIPGESDWTLIFNSVHDQWGAYEYDDSKDVVRVKVIPQAGPASETMEFILSDANTAALVWGTVMVPFSIAAK